jgi:hypothetical protein
MGWGRKRGEEKEKKKRKNKLEGRNEKYLCSPVQSGQLSSLSHTHL